MAIGRSATALFGLNRVVFQDRVRHLLGNWAKMFLFRGSFPVVPNHRDGANQLAQASMPFHLHLEPPTPKPVEYFQSWHACTLVSTQASRVNHAGVETCPANFSKRRGQKAALASWQAPFRRGSWVFRCAGRKACPRAMPLTVCVRRSMTGFHVHTWLHVFWRIEDKLSESNVAQKSF